MDFHTLTFMLKHETRLRAVADARRARDTERYAPPQDRPRRRSHKGRWRRAGTGRSAG